MITSDKAIKVQSSKLLFVKIKNALNLSINNNKVYNNKVYSITRYYIMILCVFKKEIKMERSRLKHNAYVNPAPLSEFTYPNNQCTK